MKKRISLVVVALAALLLFYSCTEILPQPPGLIEFPDYIEQTKLMGGNVGLMDFGGMPVKLYTKYGHDVLPLAIKNSGKGPLVITDIQLLQLTVPDANPVDAYDAFKFVEETFPALPLEIPAGSIVNDIFIEFDPETAGEFSGKVFVETEDDNYYIDMIGVGLWELIVQGHNDGALYILSADGSIIKEINGSGELGAATAADGIFNILCEPRFLRQFETWHQDSATSFNDPMPAWLSFDNRRAEKTTVRLKQHAEIKSYILDPYVYVPNPFPNLQNAIDECYLHRYDANPATRKIAVVVMAGSHSVGNVSFAPDVPVYGGYSGFNIATDSRQYKTIDDRKVGSSFRTVLNVSGTINLSGSELKNNVVLEGFTINKSGGVDAPLVRFDNGTTAVLAYNNILSSGADYSTAVEVTNSAAPLIKYNYINGGSTLENYSESYGIMVTEKAKPVIYKNSIKGGTATGTDSTSFGIFCDFEAIPYLGNNTPLGGDSWGIAGGAAPGSGGKSYGIYIINNGNVLSEYNAVNGGSGGTAVAVYSRYGSYIKAKYNNIFTTGGGTRIGLWADHMGRIDDLENSGIYNCDSALYKDPYSGNITSIDGVNSKFGADTNVNTAVDLSAAPKVVEYE